MKTLLIVALLLTTAACATAPVPTDEVVWVDEDRHPIPKPEENFTAKVWDGVDQTAFRPVTRMLAVDVPGPAKNVNALGEVPNSSWYVNRMSVARLTPEQVATGPCKREIDTSAVWLVKGGKVTGYNPGFLVEDTSDGKTYLLKFDRPSQRERPSAADTIVSKIYWAAGFSVPCNHVVFFDPANLRIAEDATTKTRTGEEIPITREHIRHAMRGAPRDHGLVRAAASLFLEGEPLGPFRYEGTREDDPNDVIPHEDRRELRGSKLLAAWVNHFDTREANTLTTFIEGEDGLGFVQHHFLDFGDSLGGLWAWDEMSRRLGHSFYFDPYHVLGDFLTLGAITRPWEKVTLHDVFGYFDAENFEPQEWKPGYPNPAFARMDDEDAYWAAKIISRFTDAHVEALVEEGHFTIPEHAQYLEDTLIRRRDAIVNYYMRRVTPLDDPRIVGNELCVDDLLARGGWVAPSESTYEARTPAGQWQRLRPEGPVLCFDLPRGEAAVVTARVRRADQRRPSTPVTFHLRQREGRWNLVAIDRT